MPRRRTTLALLALVAVGLGALGAARVLGRAGPPSRLRCTHPEAPPDCFVPVPGGLAVVGAQADDPAAPGFDPHARPGELRPREVRVGDLWLQRTEATVGSWRACVRDGGCRTEHALVAGGFFTAYPLDAPDEPLDDLKPVNGLTWAGAAALCRWLGGRLPTEAEWELAARGPEGRPWPWGDEPACPVAAEVVEGAAVARDGTEGCHQDGPVRVDAPDRPSPLGLTHLGGNLWEWVADDDPGGERVLKGGGWTSTDPAELRGASRATQPADARENDTGVRCAAGPPPEPGQ